jgi:hypothetical protein
VQYVLRPYATVESARRFGDRYTVSALAGTIAPSNGMPVVVTRRRAV